MAQPINLSDEGAALFGNSFFNMGPCRMPGGGGTMAVGIPQASRPLLSSPGWATTTAIPLLTGIRSTYRKAGFAPELHWGRVASGLGNTISSFIRHGSMLRYRRGSRHTASLGTCDCETLHVPTSVKTIRSSPHFAKLGLGRTRTSWD